MRWLVILISIGLFFPAVSMAQQSREFDLSQCIDYALEHSYSKKAAILESRQRRLSYRKSASRFLPRIDSYLDYQNYFNDLPTYIFPPSSGNILSGGTSDTYYPVELGLPHNMNVGLKINQVLYDQNFFLADDFKNTIDEADRLQSTQTREDIIFEVSRTYYRAASVRSRLDLIEYNYTRLDKIEDMLEIQIENGFAREIEKSKVDINRAQLKAAQQEARSGYLRLKDYLKFLMGMPVGEEFDIIVSDMKFNPQPLSDSLSMNDLTRIRLLKTREKFNELELQEKRSDYLPTLNAFAHFRLQAQQEAFDFFTGTEYWFLINLIGIRLDIPILHGFEKRKDIELSQIKSSQIELDRLRLEENLRMEYRHARNTLQNSIRQVELKEEEVSISQNAYEQSSALFEEGLLMLNELLQAESAYREARAGLIEARYQYKIAELEYLKATGNLLDYME